MYLTCYSTLNNISNNISLLSTVLVKLQTYLELERAVTLHPRFRIQCVQYFADSFKWMYLKKLYM